MRLTSLVAEKMGDSNRCRQRIAVIGCGIAGLAAVKACLEEGLQPVCFEQHGDIGAFPCLDFGASLGNHLAQDNVYVAQPSTL